MGPTCQIFKLRLYVLSSFLPALFFLTQSVCEVDPRCVHLQPWFRPGREHFVGSAAAQTRSVLSAAAWETRPSMALTLSLGAWGLRLLGVPLAVVPVSMLLLVSSTQDTA